MTGPITHSAYASGDGGSLPGDGLVEEGFIVLGGPIGEGDGENTLLVISAPDEEAVRARLGEDPWSGTVLTIDSIRPWSIWLGEPPERSETGQGA
jgi:hypothetical protein